MSVADLARDFVTSSETIRRDLDFLEEGGLLRRVHGGAVDLARVSTPELPMTERHAIRSEEKQRIAHAALRFLPTSGSIFLEASSTSLALAELLPDTLSLTIVTNGLPIAHSLAARADFDIVMIGGRVRNRSLATLDDWVHPGLETIRVDVAFLATLAFGTGGLTTPDLADARMKSRCLRIAEKSILLSESAKFGVTAMCRYGEIADLDVIITDKELDAVCAQDLRDGGVDVVLA